MNNSSLPQVTEEVSLGKASVEGQLPGCSSGRGPKGSPLASVEETHTGVPRAKCRTEKRRRHYRERELWRCAGAHPVSGGVLICAQERDQPRLRRDHEISRLDKIEAHPPLGIVRVPSPEWTDLIKGVLATYQKLITKSLVVNGFNTKIR